MCPRVRKKERASRRVDRRAHEAIERLLINQTEEKEREDMLALFDIRYLFFSSLMFLLFFRIRMPVAHTESLNIQASFGD